MSTNQHYRDGAICVTPEAEIAAHEKLLGVRAEAGQRSGGLKVLLLMAKILLRLSTRHIRNLHILIRSIRILRLSAPPTPSRPGRTTRAALVAAALPAAANAVEEGAEAVGDGVVQLGEGHESGDAGHDDDEVLLDAGPEKAVDGAEGGVWVLSCDGFEDGGDHGEEGGGHEGDEGEFATDGHF